MDARVEPGHDNRERTNVPRGRPGLGLGAELSLDFALHAPGAQRQLVVAGLQQVGVEAAGVVVFDVLLTEFIELGGERLLH